jgi:hypothetical protein
MTQYVLTAKLPSSYTFNINFTIEEYKYCGFLSFQIINIKLLNLI